MCIFFFLSGLMVTSTCTSAEARHLILVRNMDELIPFAKELLSQKPSRGLLKVYLVGSVFAVLGTVIGLVETVCHPFSSGDTTDADVAVTLTRRPRMTSARLQNHAATREDVDMAVKKILKEKVAQLNVDNSLSTTVVETHRSIANRLHAS